MKTLYAVTLAIIVGFAGHAKATHKPVTPVVVAPSKPAGVLIKKKKPRMRSGGVKIFMHKIGQMESKNNHRATNSLGMLGRYQFDPRTIRAMGFRVGREEFLGDPDIQDRVMLAFIKDNKRSLRGVIRKYHGQEVNGIQVTESGILAAAHLAGVGGVLAFFYPEKYAYKTSDSNGATVAMYMKKFGHINMTGI
jgi:hypothetical protein